MRINGDLEYTGSLTHVSDGRLKDVSGNFIRSLDALDQLQLVAYHYKAENTLNLSSTESHVGLVAQEVQQVIPEAVKESDNGYLMVNNDAIIWTMLNAIKELKTENDALREELNALKEHLGQ